jgi:peptidyl-prolyl cis-trans isomerase C
LTAKVTEKPSNQSQQFEGIAKKKKLAESLVEFEVLAQEAYRLGLEKRPEVAAAIKRILVHELMKQAVSDRKATPTEAELKSYYDQHPEEFVQAERVRVQHIFVAATKEAQIARSKAKATAEGLQATLKGAMRKGIPSPTLFGDLARQYSDDSSTKDRGGDVRFMSRAELSSQYSPEFAQAAFAMQRQNDISDVVETPKGFHVLKFTSRQAATNHPFDSVQVKETIRGRISREKASNAIEEYVAGLVKASGASIDEAALAAWNPPQSPTPQGIRPGNAGTNGGGPMGAVSDIR